MKINKVSESYSIQIVMGSANYFVTELRVVTINGINVKKTVVYTRVNGALHIKNCKNYKKVITHQHIA